MAAHDLQKSMRAKYRYQDSGKPPTSGSPGILYLLFLYRHFIEHKYGFLSTKNRIYKTLLMNSVKCDIINIIFVKNMIQPRTVCIISQKQSRV